MSRWRCAVWSVTLLAVAGTAWALPWSRDMDNQPSVKAQEAPVKEPAQSVPAGGTEKLPPPADAAALVQDRLRAAQELVNPVAADAESVARGAELYSVHCSVCHGASGKGDGLVGKKYSPPPMDLTLAYVQTQADGQLYYTIVRGGIGMPFYRDAVRGDDRWHLINYIKQGLVAP